MSVLRNIDRPAKMSHVAAAFAYHRSSSTPIRRRHCAPRVVDALVQACETPRLPFERMISRAYHDSLFMSRIAPTAMLFIPCRGGVSHRPDEYASPEAIAQGTLVLAEALARLTRSN